ncbi:MAG: hypothetical protein U0U67_11600 [Chitinophagales bacterium]
MKKSAHLFFLVLICCIAKNTQAQIINIPDVKFKAQLLAANTSNRIATDSLWHPIKIDINNNNEIELSEALTVYRLFLTDGTISSLEGIKSFGNLLQLYCDTIIQFTTLDVSSMSKLEELHINGTFDNIGQLATLNVSGCGNLKILECRNNKLTTLDVSGLRNLSDFKCDHNLLTNLNLSGCNNLWYLTCNSNVLCD